MPAISFIQDLAVIMLVAGVVTILFHRFKQPVVLGYVFAGFIIGPHTPPFGLIHDEETIKTLAELGVIFLMFCLGLELSLGKLFKVGATAFDDSEDDSQKYEFEGPAELQAAVLSVRGWKALDDSQGAGWERRPEQIMQISTVIGQSLPTFLSLYIEALTSG